MPCAVIYTHKKKASMQKFTAIMVWVTGAELTSASSCFRSRHRCRHSASETANELGRGPAEIGRWRVGHKLSDIDVKSTAHQITITVVYSKLNSGVAADRSGDVSKIVPAIEKAIAGKTEFGQVMVIHVDYAKRLENRTSLVQGFDFYKTLAGSFVPYKL